jgi:hypothetical protein
MVSTEMLEITNKDDFPAEIQWLNDTPKLARASDG